MVTIGYITQHHFSCTHTHTHIQIFPYVGSETYPHLGCTANRGYYHSISRDVCQDSYCPSGSHGISIPFNCLFKHSCRFHKNNPACCILVMGTVWTIWVAVDATNGKWDGYVWRKQERMLTILLSNYKFHNFSYSSNSVARIPFTHNCCCPMAFQEFCDVILFAVGGWNSPMACKGVIIQLFSNTPFENLQKGSAYKAFLITLSSYLWCVSTLLVSGMHFFAVALIYTKQLPYTQLHLFWHASAVN